MEQNTIQLQQTPKVNGTGIFPGQTIKIYSWNLNGFKTAHKSGKLLEFVTQNDFDILCFNETKLFVNEAETIVQQKIIPKEYYQFQYFNCCVNKEFSYSGVALLSKVEPISLQYELNNPLHDGEGRVITAEFDQFYLVCSYVPNAGQQLKRLDYRTQQWDPDFRAYLKNLEQKKPLI